MSWMKIKKATISFLVIMLYHLYEMPVQINNTCPTSRIPYS